MNKRELRKLDQQIAEKVFGFELIISNGWDKIRVTNKQLKKYFPSIYNHNHKGTFPYKKRKFMELPLPQYSKDLLEAFRILKEFERDYQISIVYGSSLRSSLPWATIRNGKVAFSAEGKTIPIAICQAALKLWEERKLSLSPPHEPHEASYKNTK